MWPLLDALKSRASCLSMDLLKSLGMKQTPVFPGKLCGPPGGILRNWRIMGRVFNGADLNVCLKKKWRWFGQYVDFKVRVVHSNRCLGCRRLCSIIVICTLKSWKRCRWTSRLTKQSIVEQSWSRDAKVVHPTLITRFRSFYPWIPEIRKEKRGWFLVPHTSTSIYWYWWAQVRAKGWFKFFQYAQTLPNAAF